MPPSITYVIVDTNCYVRLYASSLRPLLGITVSGHALMTIEELAAECSFTSGLTGRQPWLNDPSIQHDLASALLKVREPKKTQITQNTSYFRQAGNRLLEKYCSEQRIACRALSTVDAKALATAVCLNGALATDEWPLRYVAEKLDADDDGNKVKLFTTLEIVKLLESAKHLTRIERIKLMRDWRVSGECLHRDADNDYRRLFGEDPPNGQTTE